MRFLLNPFTRKLDAFEAQAGPGNDIEFLAGDSGGNIGPTAGGVVSIAGGTGIVTSGAGNTITIASSNALTGTGTTIGAVTTDLITFAMGATPGVYTFQGRASGFESVTPAGVSARLISGVRTTGAAATEIQTEKDFTNSEAALITAAVDLIISGNNMIIRVTGVVGLTINWVADFKYTFVS